MERRKWIFHDLETTPLQIKTDSTAESNDRMFFGLYSDLAEGKAFLGEVKIKFNSPLKFSMDFCNHRISISIIDHSIPLPSNGNKVWQLTELSGHGIEVQCNGVKILEIQQPDRICSSVKNIFFFDSDTASDAYRPARPGKWILINFNIQCSNLSGISSVSRDSSQWDGIPAL